MRTDLPYKFVKVPFVELKIQPLVEAYAMSRFAVDGKSFDFALCFSSQFCNDYKIGKLQRGNESTT